MFIVQAIGKGYGRTSLYIAGNKAYGAVVYKDTHIGVLLDVS